MVAEGSDEDGEGNNRHLHVGGEVVAGAEAGKGSLEGSLLSDAETISGPSIYGARGPCGGLRRHAGISTRDHLWCSLVMEQSSPSPGRVKLPARFSASPVTQDMKESLWLFLLLSCFP